MSWTSTSLDDVMQLLESTWYEEKTLRGYPMSFFSDMVAELDVFFLLNGFFMNDGLHRPPGGTTIQDYRFFPSKRQFSVYTTKILVTYSGIKTATSRSLRKSTTTLAHACRWLTEKDTNARGGWLPFSSDKYYIIPLLAPTMPAGIFLAGHLHLPEKVYFPTLPTSLTIAEWDDVMDNCYNISLLEFKKGGRLRPLLKVCLASMIRFYTKVTTGTQGYLTFENSAVMSIVRKLRDRIGLQQTVVDSNKTSHNFLKEMSTLVADDFAQKNLKESVNQSTHDLVAAQTQRLAKMDKETAKLQKSVEELTEMVSGLTQGMNALITNMQEEDVRRSRRSPSRESPSRGSPSKRKEEEGGEEEGRGKKAEEDKVEPLQKPLQLNFSSGGKLPCSGVHISALLADIANRGRMGSIRTSDFNYQDSTKTKAVLRYVDDELSESERTDLKNNNKTQLEIMNLCTAVEGRCMEKLGAREVTLKMVVAGAKRRTTQSFLGFGGRLAKVRKKEDEV